MQKSWHFNRLASFRFIVVRVSCIILQAEVHLEIIILQCVKMKPKEINTGCKRLHALSESPNLKLHVLVNMAHCFAHPAKFLLPIISMLTACWLRAWLEVGVEEAEEDVAPELHPLPAPSLPTLFL